MLTNWINWVFPNRCISCSNMLIPKEPGMCFNCLDTTAGWPTEFNPELLAQELFGGRIPISSTHLLATFHTHSPLRKALHAIKYQGNRQLAQTLGAMLYRRQASQMQFDCIVPVPIHHEKAMIRGYNQAEEIARGISESSQVPLLTALEKLQNTSSQTLLNRKERWENVAHSFQLKNPKINSRHILLVDDTLTTGATLEACAEQLLNGGAASISIAALGYASA